MNTNEIGTALRRANPVRDLEQGVPAARSEALFTSLERRRLEMLDTDEPRTHEKTTKKQRSGFRRSAVLVAAALAILIAVPAIAQLWDDVPLLERWFAPGHDTLTVYGEADGIGPECAYYMAFDPDGIPVVAGMCGVRRLDGDHWQVMSDEIAVSGVQDMAIDGAGAVWLASVDDDVQVVTADSVSRFPFLATSVAVGQDGTVWATRYNPAALPELMSYDGHDWTIRDVGPVDEVLVGPDGTVWTLGWIPTDYDPATATATSWESTVGWFTGGVYESEPIPDGAEYGEVAPDGALWAIAETSDTASDLVRFDGTSWSTLPAPIAQINDMAIHPDGTVYVTSTEYGLFAYDGTDWVQYGVEEGLPYGGVNFVEIAPDGSVWVGTSNGIAHLNPGR